MSPGTRRSLTLGAASVVVATAVLAAPVAAQDDIPQGGTIIVGEWQTGTQLNTFMSNSLKDQEPSWIISRPLVTRDEVGSLVPEFLTEVPEAVVDEDGEGFTVSMTMKDGLKWSDGTPFTLHDFKALYDWALAINTTNATDPNPDNLVACVYCVSFAQNIDPTLTGDAAYAPENMYVESITIADDGLSGEIRFQKNFSGWINAMMFQPLINPTYWGSVPANEIATRAVPGSDTLLEIPTNGPFVVSAASSDGIDFAPNPYWTADAGPHLDQLRLRFFGDKPPMFTSFLAGETDLTLNTTPADLAALEVVDPSIGSVVTDQGWLYEHLDFNTERADKGLDDPAVRRALRDAIDRQALLDVLFPGLGLTVACAITPPTLDYSATDITCPPYDPVAAGAALDELGWVFDPSQGTRVKDGNVMRLHMCTSSGNPTRLTTLGRIAQDFAAISIATDIQTSSVYFDPWDQTTPETECNIYRGTFDVALYASQVTGDPFGDYFNQYSSTRIATDEVPSGGNITRLADPVMDEDLETLGGHLAKDDVTADAIAIQERVDEVANEVPLYYRFEPLGISSRLGGFKNNPSTATKLWDVENWYDTSQG